MLSLIDSCPQIEKPWKDGSLQFNQWEIYADEVYEGIAEILKQDIQSYLETGMYSFEQDFLPLMQAVHQNPKLEILHRSFNEATKGLEQQIVHHFGKSLDVDIVLYLGLGNSAGWVLNIRGRDVILLGVEKIIELDWCDLNAMYGLIYHELGHVYQSQHGVLERYSQEQEKNFVWQLFTEGIAMYFEQVLVEYFDYYHQDNAGWKDWCDRHFQQILIDFNADLPVMTRQNQRYFGDWCDYFGWGDVGYYLGTRFVHWLLAKFSFDELINLDMDCVYGCYWDFYQQHCSVK